MDRVVHKTIQIKVVRFSSGNLPIETRLMDYMELEGKYDRIVSIGMFEHVGYKNYDRYFKKVSSLLSDDGLFLLHTIGGNNTSRSGDPWIEKYIFPHGMLPSPGQITAATEGRLVTEDWHNFGSDYDKTLMAWYHNFEASWPALAQRYDERFHRMWRFYLLLCAGRVSCSPRPPMADCVLTKWDRWRLQQRPINAAVVRIVKMCESDLSHGATLQRRP